jgi:uncharacterized protein YggE
VADDFAGIRVTASGEAKMKPDQLEIDVRAAGSAELTGDALVKYRDAATRLREALAKVDIKNVTVQEQGLGFMNQPTNAQALAAAGNANQPLKGGIDIHKSLRLTVSGIDTLSESDVAATIAKLIDTAMDAGGTTGKGSNPMLEMMGRATGSSPVKFVVTDAGVARQKAYEQAFKAAKARAENLASLADVTLGPVLSIKEAESTPTDEKSVQERMISAVYGIGGESSAADVRLASDELVELPVRITLEVRFGIK